MKLFKNKTYFILVLGVVLLVVQNSLWGANTINISVKYYAYLFIIVFVIVITFFLLKYKSLRIDILFQAYKSVMVAVIFVFGACLFIFGFMNKEYSKRNNIAVMKVKIVDATEKTSRTSNQIFFLLGDDIRRISLPSSPEVSKLIKDTLALNNSYLWFRYRKGLCNSYIIEDKKIIFE